MLQIARQIVRANALSAGIDFCRALTVTRFKPRFASDMPAEVTILKFAKLSNAASTPTRGSEKAAGYDLHRWLSLWRWRSYCHFYCRFGWLGRKILTVKCGHSCCDDHFFICFLRWPVVFHEKTRDKNQWTATVSFEAFPMENSSLPAKEANCCKHSHIIGKTIILHLQSII